MKPLIIAGNWKSNKTVAEAKEWLQHFKFQISPPKADQPLAGNNKLENKTITLCVPYTLLSVLKEEIKKLVLPVQPGAQDVSPYPEGAYTGEVSARQIKELADWVIIGHSERRKYFGETDELFKKKVEQAKTAGLKIIYCVPDAETVIPAGVDVVAYEPVWAIGTGKADTPENATGVITKIKANSGVMTVIYGGSVTPENVKTFTAEPAIDGVLPGGASLNPIKFWNLISEA